MSAGAGGAGGRAAGAAPSAGASIAARGVSKVFRRGRNEVRALEAVDFDVADGEFVAVLGPSGCGKSTLIHIAAGIVEPLRGTVAMACRRHAMVFQEPRLLPWATARDNIAYPLRLAGIRAGERRARAEAAARRVAFDAVDLDKYPAELSGGMRQRAAVARALAVDPDVVFFDEPFTAVDVGLKRVLQDLVIAAAAREGLQLYPDPQSSALRETIAAQQGPRRRTRCSWATAPTRCLRMRSSRSSSTPARRS